MTHYPRDPDNLPVADHHLYWTQLLGNLFLTHSGTCGVEVFDNVEVVSLYFSSLFPAACRYFTPDLIKTYAEVNKDKKRMEVVLLSLDKTEPEFNEYRLTLPWIAVPFRSAKIKEVRDLFSVKYQPWVMLFSRAGVLIDEELYETMAFQGPHSVLKLLP